MFIELNKITADRRAEQARYADTDDVGENGHAAQDEIKSVKVMINTDAVRCFYPRKDERPGTRITFTDGGGFAVVEAYHDVAALMPSATFRRDEAGFRD